MSTSDNQPPCEPLGGGDGDEGFEEIELTDDDTGDPEMKELAVMVDVQEGIALKTYQTVRQTVSVTQNLPYTSFFWGATPLASGQHAVSAHAEYAVGTPDSQQLTTQGPSGYASKALKRAHFSKFAGTLHLLEEHWVVKLDAPGSVLKNCFNLKGLTLDLSQLIGQPFSTFVQTELSTAWQPVESGTAPAGGLVECAGSKHYNITVVQLIYNDAEGNEQSVEKAAEPDHAIVSFSFSGGELTIETASTVIS